jgi:hypothetical protein
MTVMEGMTAGPELQKYAGTVFISYARADDVKPPFDKTTKGWVTFFWHQLRWELTNAGLPEAKLWLDRYEIETRGRIHRKNTSGASASSPSGSHPVHQLDSTGVLPEGIERVHRDRHGSPQRCRSG